MSKLTPSEESVDYSSEVHVHRSALVRGILIFVGTVSLGLGILGIFLPVLPTTPFLLLTAACYAHSSVRFYNWLMNNRWFGTYIRNWYMYRTIPLRAKLVAITLIVLTIGGSVLFVIRFWPAKLIVSAIGLGVIVYLLRVKSTPPAA